MKLKIALAQIQYQTRRCSGQPGKAPGPDCRSQGTRRGRFAFPELSLTGYVLQDLAVATAIRPHEQDPVFRKLLDESQDIDLMVGFVTRTAATASISPPLTSQRVRSFHIHNKVYLPTYGMFDEAAFCLG